MQFVKMPRTVINGSMHCPFVVLQFGSGLDVHNDAPSLPSGGGFPSAHGFKELYCSAVVSVPL
jgi:hypothetical protein